MKIPDHRSTYVLVLILLCGMLARGAAQLTSCLSGSGLIAAFPFPPGLIDPRTNTPKVNPVCAQFCMKCTKDSTQLCTAEQIASGAHYPVWSVMDGETDKTLKLQLSTINDPDFSYCKYSTCNTNDCQDKELKCPAVASKEACAPVVATTGK
jgi:hypothetical protein